MYDYPIVVLRLCIAAYRLGRVIRINGVVSRTIFATRGITAGAVHATTELRLVLIHWVDKVVANVMYVTITFYVDDSSFEAAGSERLVIEARMSQNVR